VNSAQVSEARSIQINELSAMTVGRWFLLLGFACLVIVVFTHVAERLHLGRVVHVEE
jgi:hypothetical protein